MPSVAVESSAIGWPFLEIIYVMMSREKLNLLDWMVSKMLDYKRDVCAPLALQSYIMALVLRTIKNFKGNCKVGHQVYWHFIDNEAYLEWEPSPMSCRIHEPNSLGTF